MLTVSCSSCYVGGVHGTTVNICPYVSGVSQNSIVSSETRLQARCSQGSNVRGGKRFVHFPKCPDELQGPPILLVSQYWRLLLGYKVAEVKTE